MDPRKIEPRTAMWAVAEIIWEEPTGTPNRAPATLEDTSPSGACLRVKHPFAVGSRVTIRWRREQFLAIAKNCRSDGREFLLGVRRAGEGVSPSHPPVKVGKEPQTGKLTPAEAPLKENLLLAAPRFAAKPDAMQFQPASPPPVLALAADATRKPVTPETKRTVADPRSKNEFLGSGAAPAHDTHRPSERQPRAPEQDLFPRHERKVMSSKPLFSKFWRRQPGDSNAAPDKPIATEAPVNKSNSHATEGFIDPHHDLLSYDDIYHAAGILSPRSGYGIHKVVEMLNSERLRELSKEVKRASVLMALDAAGTSVEQLMQDATRRQGALSAYEGGQRKQLEDFEAAKSQENAQIEAEMERIRAHYAERIQHNRDQVVKEKETLRNWQNAMQHEMQRISEVIELCGAQPAPAATAAASTASNETNSSAEKGLAARAQGAS